ncbi:DUF2285 domain-containing protein [Herbaspirillum sp. HC18]|nr:DUF2285 domain-containing protein [Herbaspirillum sp. HC18]
MIAPEKTSVFRLEMDVLFTRERVDADKRSIPFIGNAILLGNAYSLLSAMGVGGEEMSLFERRMNKNGFVWPVWFATDSYPNSEEWSHRRWAWEFLRRNEKYQEASLSLKGSPKDRQARAHEFGRKAFKSFKEDYKKQEDSNRHWLSETIMEWRSSNQKDGEEEDANFKFKMSMKKVAIVFDLSQTIKGGEAVITSLLDHAKEILTEEMYLYAQTLPEDQRPKQHKPHENMYLTWLRVYDAIAGYSEAEEEVAKVLFPDKFGMREELSDDEKQKARKKVRALFRRAQEIVDEGYLQLVPRDYLPKKTPAKQKKNLTNGEKPVTALD